MANVALVTTQRLIKNQTIDCTYIGTIQNDGWIYFNDDVWWRAKLENNWFDFASLQRFYIDKQIWMPTNMAIVKSIKKFNVTGASNMINGGGAVAPNANVETAVQWAIEKASLGTISYSWDNRNLKNPNGDSYDCSSFVITAFYVGGFDASSSWTPDMRSGFEALGFTWIPGSYFAAEDLLRGDIQLNENPGASGHTNIYIGNNQDVDCGSDPCRIITHTPDNFGTGWHGILRYTG